MTDLMTKDDRQRLVTALRAANTKGASPDAVADLRTLLREMPQAWKFAGDMAKRARDAVLEHMFDAMPSVMESVKAGCEHLAEELRQPTDGPLEALLIDQIVMCWLDEQISRSAYAVAMDRDKVSIESSEHWQRKLTSTQQRYLRAVESLARVRRLMRLMVQVNIAQPGSQVVNIGGDMQTAGKSC